MAITEQNDEIDSILLNYRASLHNNFESNDTSLTRAREAIQRLIVEARIDEHHKFDKAADLNMNVYEWSLRREQELQASLNNKQEDK